MQLHLIRHGIAAERGSKYPDDLQRPLTITGQARMRREADALGILDIAFGLILTSPLLRATQTAAIVSAGSGMRTATPVTESETLACNGTPMRFKNKTICRIGVPFDGTHDRARLGELRWFLPPRVLRAIGRG